MTLRIATFNLENFDDGPGIRPPLADRIQIMRPQLERMAADIVCMQEVHSQGQAGARQLLALDALIQGTPYRNHHREATRTTGGQLYDQRNLVTLSRYCIVDTQIIRDSEGPRPTYQMATANPPDSQANVVSWERPMLYTQIDIGSARTIHVINVHLKWKLASDIPGQRADSYTWRTVSAWAEGSFLHLVDETHGAGAPG